MASLPLVRGAHLRLAFFIGLSILIHLCLIGAARPHPPHPFRSIGLSARLAVEPDRGPGTVLVGRIAQVDKAPRPSAQTQESVPQRRPRRAVLIPNTDFGAQLDLNSAPSPAEGKAETGLFSLGIPAVQEKYFSASEVDIRAEPFSDLVSAQARTMLDSPAAAPGRLKMRLLIDETGKVTSVEILEAFPPEILQLVAPEYILNIGFAPARINDLAVKSQKIVEFIVDPDASP